MRHFVAWYSSQQPFTPRLHLVTNNPVQLFLDGYDQVDTDMDCVMCHVLGWGRAFRASGLERRGADSGDPEFKVSSSDRFKNLDHDNLWLNRSDASWRRPLCVSLRYYPERNARTRPGGYRKACARRGV